MPAKLHGDALHALGGQAREMLADRHRAGERHLAHRLRGDQVRRHIRRHAEHEIEHTRRQAGINKAAHQFDAASRRLLRRLEDQRAASRKRAADLARRRQGREVPGCEGDADADRLLRHELAHALHAARHDAAIGAAAFLGIPFDDVGGDQHLEARLGNDLALLLRHDARDGVRTLAHQVGRLAQQLGAVIGRCGPPDFEALGRRGKRLIEIGRAGVR
jgi:ParB family chromosome partitioning protein